MRLIELSSPADTARLQRLLERCSDYYELHEGWPTPPDAAEYELTAIPSPWTPRDLLMLALEDQDGALHAVAQVLRNYPDRGTWWIGMLLVAPEWRGRGVGADLLRQVTEAATAGGAIAMQLAVSLQNPRAQAFWEAAGFRDAGKTRRVTARSGHVGTIRILCRGEDAG